MLSLHMKTVCAARSCVENCVEQELMCFCDILDMLGDIPADWETKRPFGMTTLSSEFLAQSTMPLRPFMGKLMSVITDTAGSLWMLATAVFGRHRWRNTNDCFSI